MATHWTLGCDAADPQRLATFWAFALGYVSEPGFDGPDNASIIDPDGRPRDRLPPRPGAQGGEEPHAHRRPGGR